MGIYYKIVCDDLKQQLNTIGSPKFPAIAHPYGNFSSLVLFALGTIWNGYSIRMANDMCDDYYEKYEDVTEKVFENWKKTFKCSEEFLYLQ